VNSHCIASVTFSAELQSNDAETWEFASNKFREIRQVILQTEGPTQFNPLGQRFSLGGIVNAVLQILFAALIGGAFFLVCQRVYEIKFTKSVKLYSIIIIVLSAFSVTATVFVGEGLRGYPTDMPYEGILILAWWERFIPPC
jgi:hypothetical protein